MYVSQRMIWTSWMKKMSGQQSTNTIGNRDMADSLDEKIFIKKFYRYLYEKDETLKKNRIAEQKLKMRDELDR